MFSDFSLSDLSYQRVFQWKKRWYPVLPLASMSIVFAGCTTKNVELIDVNLASSSSSSAAIDESSLSSSISSVSDIVPPTSSTSSVSPDATSSIAPTPVAPPTSATMYRNGEYSAKGEYASPAGAESIVVSLTLQDDLIAAVTVKGNAEMGKSQRFQQAFIDGVQTAVVGKSIDGLSLGVINGSSLTPKGFNDALAKIVNEAR